MCLRQTPRYDRDSESSNMDASPTPLPILEPRLRPLPGPGIPATDQSIPITPNPSFTTPDWTFADAAAQRQRRASAPHESESPAVSPRTIRPTRPLDGSRAITPPDLLDFLVEQDLKNPDKAPWLPSGLLDDDDVVDDGVGVGDGGETELLYYENLPIRAAPRTNAWPLGPLMPMHPRAKQDLYPLDRIEDGGALGHQQRSMVVSNRGVVLSAPVDVRGTMNERVPDIISPMTPLPGPTLAPFHSTNSGRVHPAQVALPSLREEFDELNDLPGVSMPSDSSHPGGTHAKMHGNRPPPLDLPSRRGAGRPTAYRDTLVTGLRWKESDRGLGVDKKEDNIAFTDSAVEKADNRSRRR